VISRSVVGSSPIRIAVLAAGGHGEERVALEQAYRSGDRPWMLWERA